MEARQFGGSVHGLNQAMLYLDFLIRAFLREFLTSDQ